ncbi:MAG: hypothetical protein ACUVXJ_02705 [Phycisphaerae bacterium]
MIDATSANIISIVAVPQVIDKWADTVSLARGLAKTLPGSR